MSSQEESVCVWNCWNYCKLECDEKNVSVCKQFNLSLSAVMVLLQNKAHFICTWKESHYKQKYVKM